jgi:hypothetical protein
VDAVVARSVAAFATGDGRTTTASVEVAMPSAAIAAASTDHVVPIMSIALLGHGLLVCLGFQNAVQISIRELRAWTSFPLGTAQVTKLEAASATIPGLVSVQAREEECSYLMWLQPKLNSTMAPHPPHFCQFCVFARSRMAVRSSALQKPSCLISLQEVQVEAPQVTHSFTCASVTWPREEPQPDAQ